MHIQSDLPRFTLTFLGALLLGFQCNVYAEINLNDNLLQNKGIQLQLLTEVYEDNLDGDINLAFNLEAVDDNIITTKLNDTLGLSLVLNTNLQASLYNQYDDYDSKHNPEYDRLSPSTSVAIMFDDHI